MYDPGCHETHQGIARMAAPIAYVPVSLREDYLSRVAQRNLLSSSPQLSELPKFYLGGVERLLGNGDNLGYNITAYSGLNSQNGCCGN